MSGINAIEPGSTIAVPDPLFTNLPAGTGVLDTVPDLPDELAKAERALKYWKDRVEELQGALREVAGDHEELTLNGAPAFTYSYVNRFRSKEFAKDHPDLFEAYQIPTSGTELDVALLKRVRPGLYRQYQSRSLRRVA